MAPALSHSPLNLDLSACLKAYNSAAKGGTDMRPTVIRPVSTEEVPGTIWGTGTTTGTSSHSALSTAVSPLRERSTRKVPVKLRALDVT